MPWIVIALSSLSVLFPSVTFVDSSKIKPLETHIEPVEVIQITNEELPTLEEIDPIDILRQELVPICTCESGQGTGRPQHFNIETGEVLRGYYNDQDIGMCQINLKYHGERLEELGLDPFNELDNVSYANMLYEEEGNTPWKWSEGCWGNK